MSEKLSIPCYFTITQDCPTYCPIYKMSMMAIQDTRDQTGVNISSLSQFASLQRQYIGSLSELAREDLISRRVARMEELVGDPGEFCLNFESEADLEI